MLTGEIYRAGVKIDTKKFQKDFMILAEHSGTELRWEADEETASKKGGSILVWIRAAVHPPEIHFIPPGWELIVDGETLVSEDYPERDRFDIEVNGKIIEIRHNQYRFICYTDV